MHFSGIPEEAGIFCVCGELQTPLPTRKYVPIQAVQAGSSLLAAAKRAGQAAKSKLAGFSTHATRQWSNRSSGFSK
jgi:hypothetical protein